MRSKLATCIELVGLASVSAGAWTVNVTVGLIVSGVALFAVGYALED